MNHFLFFLVVLLTSVVICMCENEVGTTVPRVVTVGILGKTGSGKSALCSTLTGKVYKESFGAEEETMQTVLQSGSFDGQLVSCIDTPGYLGKQENTLALMENMAEFFQGNSEAQALILALEFPSPRLDDGIRKLLILLSGMYPQKAWWKQLAIVWTKCYVEHTTPEEKQERMKLPIKGLKGAIKEFVPNISEDDLLMDLEQVPQFFVDSIQARNPGHPDRKELSRCLAWASTKQPLIKMGKMRVKKGTPILETKMWQEEIHHWFTNENNRRCPGGCKHHITCYAKIRTVQEERYRQEYTDGQPTYTDWKMTHDKEDVITVEDYIDKHTHACKRYQLQFTKESPLLKQDVEDEHTLKTNTETM